MSITKKVISIARKIYNGNPSSYRRMKWLIVQKEIHPSKTWLLIIKVKISECNFYMQS